jgi:hypothetical protein
MRTNSLSRMTLPKNKVVRELTFRAPASSGASRLRHGQIVNDPTPRTPGRTAPIPS